MTRWLRPTIRLGTTLSRYRGFRSRDVSASSFTPSAHPWMRNRFPRPLFSSSMKRRCDVNRISCFWARLWAFVFSGEVLGRPARVQSQVERSEPKAKSPGRRQKQAIPAAASATPSSQNSIPSERPNACELLGGCRVQTADAIGRRASPKQRNCCQTRPCGTEEQENPMGANPDGRGALLGW
jgi:hypothetical protein